MRADDVCFARFFIVGKGRSCGRACDDGGHVRTCGDTYAEAAVEIRAMMGNTLGWECWETRVRTQL